MGSYGFSSQPSDPINLAVPVVHSYQTSMNLDAATILADQKKYTSVLLRTVSDAIIITTAYYSLDQM